jgi:hypothetical protein
MLAATPLAHATASYWIASTLSMAASRGGFEDMRAIRALNDILAAPPSDRLKCAAGGTLVSSALDAMADQSFEGPRGTGR